MVIERDEQGNADSTIESEEVTHQEVSETFETEPESDERAVVNPYARLIAVITDPVAAMRGVVQKGSWWIPAIVFVIAMVIFNLIAGDVVQEFSQDATRNRMQQMVEQGRMTQEQVDQIMERQSTGSASGIASFISPIISIFFMKLIYTLLFLLGGNVLFGGDAKFGNYWAVLWYAGVIGAIGTILSSVLINITGDMYGAQLGLGILTKSDPTSLAHKVAQAFDVFKIWEGIIAGVGLSVVARISTGKGIAWGLIVYLGFALIGSFITGSFVAS